MSSDLKSHRPRFLYLVMNERVQDDGQFAIVSGGLQVASARHTTPRSSPTGNRKVQRSPPRAPVLMQVKRKRHGTIPNPGGRSECNRRLPTARGWTQDAKDQESNACDMLHCVHVITWLPFLGTKCRLASGTITGVEEDTGGYLEGICNRWRTTSSSTEVAPPPCVS